MVYRHQNRKTKKYITIPLKRCPPLEYDLQRHRRLLALVQNICMIFCRFPGGPGSVKAVGFEGSSWDL